MIYRLAFLFFCFFVFNLKNSFATGVFNIDIGSISIDSTQSINNTFFTKEEFIPLECGHDCDSYQLKIKPINPILEHSNNNEYYFPSGINGLHLKVKFSNENRNNTPKNGFNLTLSLINNQGLRKPNDTYISKPLFHWSLEKKDKNNELEKKYSGTIIINGHLIADAGGCEAFGDMTFNFPSIDTSKIKSIAKISDEMDTRIISIICSPGSSNFAEISFHGEYFPSNPHILKTKNGIGFIIKNDITNSPVDWSGGQKVTVNLSSSGITNVNFHAHYIRMSNKLIEGEVKAIAKMVINYK